MTKRVLVVVAAVVAIVAMVGSKAIPTRVSGAVVNSRGAPLIGARVLAVRNGEVVGETRTGDKGAYELVVGGDRPFDLLYKDGAHDTSLLMELSPGFHHTIKKVLLGRDEILDPRSRIGKAFAKQYEESVRDPRVRGR